MKPEPNLQTLFNQTTITHENDQSKFSTIQLQLDKGDELLQSIRQRKGLQPVEDIQTREQYSAVNEHPFKTPEKKFGREGVIEIDTEQFKRRPKTQRKEEVRRVQEHIEVKKLLTEDKRHRVAVSEVKVVYPKRDKNHTKILMCKLFVESIKN